MINLKPSVIKALESIEIVKKVFYYYPQSWVKLPCISFYEANNSIATNADDKEYLSEIVMVIDVWAKDSSSTSEVAISVDETMVNIGFYREFAHDVHEDNSEIRHKTMRFKYIGG